MALACLAGVFTPLASTVSPAHADSVFEPYSGTAKITAISPPSLAPASAGQDLGSIHTTLSFAIGDATHYFIQSQTLSPALESGMGVLSANGSQSIRYDELLGYASSQAITGAPPAGWDPLNLYAGSAVPVATTTQGVIAGYRQRHLHAKLTGHETILGRAADLVEVWPLWKESTSSCTSAKTCAQHEKGYGRARLWLDTQHLTVLRYEQHGVPAHVGGPQEYIFQLTALTYGAGPTAEQLAYTPPVPSVPSPSSCGSSSSMDSGYLEHPPNGFLPVPAPRTADGTAYSAAGSGAASGCFSGSSDAVPFEIQGLFVLGAGAKGQPSTAGDPFVFVQQRVRVTGLPDAMKTGTSHMAGTCTAYTGTYRDGLHWLALAHGKIVLELTSNSLSEEQLAGYVARRVCS